MTIASLETLVARVESGTLVPYLGSGALEDVVDANTGAAMPASSDDLIIAMNGGKPMSAKLMYEFPRAAMNLELKKGRSFVTRFLDTLYAGTKWKGGAIQAWLAKVRPAYVIDSNRDLLLQNAYAGKHHILVQGLARMGGTEYRFKVFAWRDGAYHEIAQEEVAPGLPILFKPLGSPAPESNFIASDADFVDYITELMGGFAIPGFLKTYRKEKQYLFIGVRMTRDTERMVLSDIVYGAGKPTGYAVIAEPTDKERRFCERIGVEIVECSTRDLIDLVSGKVAA